MQTKNSLPMGVERKGWTKRLIFIDLNSLPAVAVNSGNRKVIGNKKWYTTSLEILKNLVIRSKAMIKWKQI